MVQYINILSAEQTVSWISSCQALFNSGIAFIFGHCLHPRFPTEDEENRDVVKSDESLQTWSDLFGPNHLYNLPATSDRAVAEYCYGGDSCVCLPDYGQLTCGFRCGGVCGVSYVAA